ncbi:MAG TPA: hypothetical protein DDY91_04155 [Planctomycetaceae bacterium]|nr:hypothetical protein [Planctomycetaceae bacterium]
MNPLVHRASTGKGAGRFSSRKAWIPRLVCVGVVCLGWAWGDWSLTGAARGAEPTATERAHWAFQPLGVARQSAVPGGVPLRATIDALIDREVTSQNLAKSVPADRAVWLRRVTLDLVGLPPTPEEVRDFVLDESPDAYERVVERLLASPRYGVRWARHWLDVVRYADARDLIQLPAESDFREIWRYRDWVVQAHNVDLPYDQFIRLQVAGDLLQPADPNLLDAEALVATGFLALADFVPGDVDKTQMIADYVNDQIDVLGRSVLGLTIGCARCHDHKYDPISLHDYYALAGIFFSTKLIPSPVKGNTPLVRSALLPPAEIARIEQQARENQKRLTLLPSEILGREEQAWLAGLIAQVEADTAAGLLAGWHAATARPAGLLMSYEDAAGRAGVSTAVVRFWARQLDGAVAGDRLHALAQLADVASAQKQSGELALGVIARLRQMVSGPAPAAAKSPLLVFRADDRRLEVDAEQHVTRWQDRGGPPQPAVPVVGAPSPRRVTLELAGRERSVVRFDGEQLLQVPQRVPEVGSLFVVFRPDPAGDGSQRLIGWEDSAVGRHGLGLMISPAGGVHVIVRRDGASGDVVVPPPANPGLQVLSVRWGPEGVKVSRNGEPVGANQGITAVSSDPTMTGLHLGGPGSGSASRFRGELCELRVYGVPVDDAGHSQIEGELSQRWLESGEGPVADPGDPLVTLAEELCSEGSPYWVAPSERARLLSAEQAREIATLKAELVRRQGWKKPEIPQGVVVQEGGPAETPHAGFGDANVYLRGQWKTPGPKVPRGVPKVFAAEPLKIASGSGRRELAEWLTSATNPLTARVLVNRLWQHHFGAGLVRTSTNFGLRGEHPSHPELLDHMAAELIHSGWSVKAIQREMVLSETYRRSSNPIEETAARDPENRWWAHMPRRPLEAEALRDSLLSVSGELDETPGGPGFLEANQPRRSLYLMSVRTGSKASEFCPLFDGPTGGGVIEQRSQSIVAPQALYLLNDPFLARIAHRLTERLRRDVAANDLESRLNRLYQLLFARQPTAGEVAVAQDLLGPDAGAGAWERLCLVILCTNEFFYVD